jgi:cytochrome P450
MTNPFAFNPIDPAVRRDPYALYERGRREFPAFAHEGLPMRLISLFRHEDCLDVLKDWKRFSSDFSVGMKISSEILALGDPSPPSMISTDPPVHDRLRNLVNKAFTPRMVKRLEPKLRRVAAELVRDAVKAGEVDLVEALTYPLPVVAIAEMIGVPVEDREQFKTWSDQLVANLGAAFFAELSVDDARKNFALRDEMQTYFKPLALARKSDPQDDLLTGLVHAEHEGSHLNQEEMLQMLILLLVAGNETTTTLIGNAAITLLEHPHQLARLRAEPKIMPLAVDEVLRFASPIQFDPRRCTEAGEIHGVRFEENDLMLCWIGSANRDEEVFDQPDRFDVGRVKNPHLAFGHGLHFCLGHNLARLEARVALDALLEGTSGIERVGDAELPLHPSPVFRSFTEIRVALSGR